VRILQANLQDVRAERLAADSAATEMLEQVREDLARITRVLALLADSAMRTARR
jgi:hypothetical protein